MASTSTDSQAHFRGDWYFTAVAAGCVAGALSLTLIAALAITYVRLRVADPLASTKLAQMKKDLYANPTDERLKDAIREKDLQLRREYFLLRKRLATGGLLLGGMLVLLVVSIRIASRLARRPPRPSRPASEPLRDERVARYARWSVAALAAAIVCAGVVVAIIFQPAGHVTRPARGGKTSRAQEAPDYPTPAEIRKNWPRFRGPAGAGVSAYANIPVSWNVETGENVLWKVPVPLAGMNSPVAWGGKVFLTGANKSRREVYCFDADTGRLIWRRAVRLAGSRGDTEELPEDAGLAAPTACTDGLRVYAIFPNGDLAAFDFFGRQVWSRNLGRPDNVYGHATSLLTWKGRLIVQYDQGSPEDKLSKIMFIDSATGKILRTIRRPVGGSWTTPAVFRIGGLDRLVTVGDPWVIAYAPADGRELWRARYMGPDVAPSPIYAAGLVFTVTAEAKLSAIRPSGTGDVTKTAIAWSAEDDLPAICSPLSDGKLLYTLTSEGGVLSCYEAATGRRLWRKEYSNMGFDSSPSLVGGRVYLFSRAGTAVVLDSARTYREIARSGVGEAVHTCPAFLDGRMFVRGVKHLLCIGSRKK